MSSSGTCTTMAISGEFDLANEPQFNSAAKSALASGCREFIVDLDGVTYLDGRALAALMAFFKTVSAAGGFVRIVTANPFHRRLFSITGIDRVISLFSTREQAEAAGAADGRKKA